MGEIFRRLSNLLKHEPQYYNPKTKREALEKAVPRLMSDNPNIRGIGWRILRRKFPPSKARKIYDNLPRE